MKFKSSSLATLSMMCFIFSSCAGLAVPSQYKPLSGDGPVVLMISGKTGPSLYAEFAGRLAEQGYHVLLYDGNDFPFNQTQTCQAKIGTIIKNEFASSQRPNGKIAVIGYSLGGATALACAAGMPDEIALIIAYYPATGFITDRDACVDRFGVPIIILQGEDDRYFDCCRVETIRDMQQAARNKGRDIELTVYPQAGHGFNLGPMKNKELDRDSWGKTTDALKRHLPSGSKALDPSACE